MPRTLTTLICASILVGGAAAAPREMAAPAYFEPNRGQADGAAAFVGRGANYTIFLQPDGGALYRLSSGTVRLELAGGGQAIHTAGEQPWPSVTHYYGGKYRREARTVPHYGSVRERGVYPGVDMLWRSRGPDLEYEFWLDAGADPRRIQLRFSGARSMHIDRGGNLVLETGDGRLCHRRPVAWQEIAGRRVEVDARFRLNGAGAGATFQLGRYDRRQALWIDPVLSYVSYLGGAGFDAGYAIAVNASGKIYVTGTTASVGFPSYGPLVSSYRDAFVSEFNADGLMVYTTILAGTGDTCGQAIIIDSAGNVYVAGYTEASDFPATPGAWQTVSGGGTDAFIAKLDPAGHLLYATYAGGSGSDYATGIAVDGSGNAYVSGYTASINFPTTIGAAQPVYRGGAFDAFAIKLNAAGSAPFYATLLGGSGTDIASAIALDPAGNVCIAGYTDSTDLPVVAALQSNPGGEGDALIACLNANGAAWTTVSYLGGIGLDDAYALVRDATGNLYVAGTTFSVDFPTTPNAFQTALAGSYDAFVVKLNPGAGSVAYATLFGGSGSDAATALAMGSAGDIWLAGYTSSTDFPLVSAWQSFNHGGFDGFVAHLSADGSALLASSYLGGTGDDQIWGIASGPGGQLFLTGTTGSADFPITPGAAQPTAPGGIDAFLAQINPLLTGYTISGQVTVSGSTPLGGVTMTLSGAASGSTRTDGSGNYGFIGLSAGGSYTITPSGSGYNFNPSVQTFDSMSTNQTANFSASCPLGVTPAAVFLDSGGQAGPPLNVVTNAPVCFWVASASAGFIQITSGGSGTGNGTTIFTVASNHMGADLTGAVNINGQAVAITQRETATIFTDVQPAGYYFDAANLLYSQGITGGCSAAPLMYCPGANITRGQMAVFIISAIEGGAGFSYTTTPYFTDVPPTYPFFKWIQKLKDLGITGGCSATAYCPDNSVTRGEMAVFVIDARYGAISFSYPSTPYFSDVPPSYPFFPFIQKMAQAGITGGCAAGLYCPGQTLSRGDMSVFIATGLLNELLGASIPVVTAAVPNSAARGQTVTVTLSGASTHFAQGATQVVTAPGITPSGIQVNSATSLTVQFAVSAGAAPGPYSIVVTTGTEEAVLPNGFTVQ